MTKIAFLRRLRKTPRRWHITAAGEIRVGVQCPITSLLRKREEYAPAGGSCLGLRESTVISMMHAADGDRGYTRLRRELLKACGLFSVSFLRWLSLYYCPMPRLADPQHEMFAREYARHGRLERGVVAAGYHCKTAKEGSSSASAYGSLLLKNTKIYRRVEELREQHARALDMTELKVLRELKRIGFSDIRTLFDADGRMRPMTDISDEAAAAVSSVEVDELTVGSGKQRQVLGQTKKIRLWDKVGALEKLARALGMFQEDKEREPPAGLTQINFYMPAHGRGREAVIVNGEGTSHDENRRSSPRAGGPAEPPGGAAGGRLQLPDNGHR